MDCEVAVIGAGAAGSSLALLLAKEGVEVCLIDKGEAAIKGDIFGGRTAALNLASEKFLEELDVRNGMKDYLTPFKDIYVWDSDGTSSLEFSSEEIGHPKLGDVVPNNAILSSIFLQLSNHDNLKFLSGDSLKSLDPQEQSITVHTETGKKISCQLVVGADGALSSVRELSSIGIRTWSYEQKALIANLKAEKPHNNTAYQVFTKHGPIALIDKNMPVIAIAPNDELLDKLKSNLQEVKSRGSQMIVFEDKNSKVEKMDAMEVIPITSNLGRITAPIIFTIPLQLLSYHVALFKGTDIDKPRNLAKSVTVE